MIVLDASAVLTVVAGAPRPAASLADRIAADRATVAPHLLDVEVVHGLRRLVRTGAVSPDGAARALADIGRLGLVRYPHTALVQRMFQLRDNLSAYDAAYVALAEVLACPLVTCDARLASAPGHRAAVEVFGS